MIGKGNPNYKDGKSYSKLFKELRVVIRERDEHKCVTCDETTNLVVHHIDHTPWHNTSENLITLCRNCHGDYHKTPSTTLSTAYKKYAKVASKCMTSKLKERETFLLNKYSSTIA